MSQPYIGEIRIFAGNFAPNGWAFCNGQLLAISEYGTLYNLISTTYGGDGQTTFALPNMQGRLPVHNGTYWGNTYVLGSMGGVEEVTLTTSQIPSHSHVMIGMAPTGAAPQGNATHQSPLSRLPAGGSIKAFAPTLTDVMLNAAAIDNAGGSQPHSNLMPYLCVNFIISLFGVYPTQT
jgi:microcystin-dependent protein